MCYGREAWQIQTIFTKTSLEVLREIVFLGYEVYPEKIYTALQSPQKLVIEFNLKICTKLDNNGDSIYPPNPDYDKYNQQMYAIVCMLHVCRWKIIPITEEIFNYKCGLYS